MDEFNWQPSKLLVWSVAGHVGGCQNRRIVAFVGVRYGRVIAPRHGCVPLANLDASYVTSLARHWWLLLPSCVLTVREVKTKWEGRKPGRANSDACRQQRHCRAQLRASSVISTALANNFRAHVISANGVDCEHENEDVR